MISLVSLEWLGTRGRDAATDSEMLQVIASYSHVPCPSRGRNKQGTRMADHQCPFFLQISGLLRSLNLRSGATDFMLPHAAHLYFSCL